MPGTEHIPDVYEKQPYDTYPGARERSKPGKGPNEIVYDKTQDGLGNKVSNKFANQGMLASQKRRLEHERKLAEQKSNPSPPTSSTSRSVISTLFLLALFLPLLSSFLTTNSYTFNLSPRILPPIQRYWRTSPLNPFSVPLRQFTIKQLSKYDGSNEGKGIYVAIKGEVFDVTSNERIYGPGGSYHMMAGRDASRAFITGCFQSDLTHDLRGLTNDDLKSLDSWHKFFATHETYRLVGHVTLPEINPASPVPFDCRTENTDQAPGSDNNPGGFIPGPVQVTAT